MNNIQIFKYENNDVRTVEMNGEPWFVGKDVASVLGCKDTVNALKTHVDEDEKTGWQITTQFGVKETTIINESGLYSLILSSKLPTAKQFKRWVTSEVLPSIRKNGGYIAGQEQMTPEELMAKALLVANKTLAERDARISELTVQNTIMQPKAEYFDELVDRNTLTNFRETAKELGISEKAFIRFLIDKKYIFRNQRGKLMAYADRSDGLFEVKECYNEKTNWSGIQTLVTPKGRETFRLLCLKAL